MDYTNNCIASTALVKDAMRKLNKVSEKILCVLEGEHFWGTLTDGDLRRYLINGGKLEDSVYAAAQRQAHTAPSRKQAMALLQRGTYPGIPVVDADGRLLDLVLNTEELQLPQLGIPVVIMAGGKGTRLDPYTRVLPKPLIPVGELPIIEHIMGQFIKFGCQDFRVIVNHKKQLLKAYFSESEQPYQISWYEEDKPLGTGGGLSLLKGHMDSTFFLSNCDILLHSDYDSMLRFHRENGDVITIVGAYKNMTIPYGVIELGKGGVLETMREKPEFSFLTNTGVYIVEPEVLEDIPEKTLLSFPDIIDQQRKKGRKVAIFPVGEDDWLDMGQLDELKRMEEKLGI